MTPQENQLVDELFDRLARLEAAPRDAGAEQAIADGLRRAPHAVYALVQTALVRDEALKRANARIEELEARLAGADAPAQQQQPGFLDSMREALGGRPARGSVPNVRAATYPPQSGQPQGGPQAPYPPPLPPYGPGFGTGGSFLGTAASTAAGVIGGALLLDGIRSMFGHHAFGGYGPSAFGNVADDRAAPWGSSTSGSAADSQLARDAGIDNIGDQARGSGTDRTDAGPAGDPALTDDMFDDGPVADDSEFADNNFDDGGFGGDDGYDA